jgi:DNA-binding LytR/AlgR family response regulator
MNLKCILVDDQPLSHDIIRTYIAKLENIELLSTFTKPTEALNYLDNNEVDFVFLDIEMEELNGFEFIESKSKSLPVVVLSAYSKYAIESYEYREILDFMAKPISFIRFLKSINKIKSHLSNKNKTETIYSAHDNSSSQLIIKVKDEILLIDFSKISYIQAWGNYVKVFCENEYFLTQKKMNEIEKETTASFVRIHKSYIVNIDKISNLAGNTVVLQNTKIPIGNSFKQILLLKINELKKIKQTS